jgi:hypothetical protein
MSIHETSEETMTREAYDRAILVSMLFMLWGAFSLVSGLRRAFLAPNVAQALVGALGLTFFLRTRATPRRILAQIYTAAIIAYSLLILPWTAVVWSRLGRPWEAFAVPQIGMLTMALVSPPRLIPGIALLAAFAVETAFVDFYARHVGLGAALPTTEPYVSIMVAIFGIYVLSLRRRRRRLVLTRLRLQSEAEALGRLGPLFATVRDEIDASLDAISSALRRLNGPEVESQKEAVARALRRVADLRDRIQPLLPEPSRNDEALEQTHERDPLAKLERQFITSDAHAGATVFAAISATLGIFFISVATAEHFPGSLLAIMMLIAISSAGYLLATHSRPPSRSRSTAFVLLLWATLLLVATYGEGTLARDAITAHRPYTPFIPHKLLLVTLPLVAPALGLITLVAVLATAVDALLLFFLLHLSAHTSVVSVVEPWTTMAFALVGFLLMSLHEQRRVASFALLRAESNRTSLQRRASLLLALRDQLNSPLQVLVLYASRLAQHSPESGPAILARVSRLVAMSRRLASIDELGREGAEPISFDAIEALRRL